MKDLTKIQIYTKNIAEVNKEFQIVRVSTTSHNDNANAILEIMQRTLCIDQNVLNCHLFRSKCLYTLCL